MAYHCAKNDRAQYQPAKSRVANKGKQRDCAHPQGNEPHLGYNVARRPPRRDPIIEEDQEEM